MTIVSALLVAGCATALPGGTPTPPKVAPDTSGSYDKTGSYQLSAQELALDCKKLTGRMQVRLLQIRDPASRPERSTISRGTETIVKPLFGGPATDPDPRNQLARDRALLDAYNRQLAAKGCPTFDVYKELQQSDVRHTPRPQPKGEPKR